ncbi:hypothetical protein N7457_005399 [Penicillium paradoxum]|uniref:uncharacterized protein n=1 Tax=Penicillium paradoxum TaxID=176176 RepID=UPI0025497F3A|nr:uncharacterized protein N7457_005399 [Penicillium paradoxum]KAJ5780239.1 hypothetical protein N7457_005399 [Penicillium paradoxum]
MPDMHAIFNSGSPPKLDLSNAPSQMFQVPATTASSSLYSLSLSRKRPRRNTEKLSSHFETEYNSSSPMIHSNYRSVGGGNDFHASAELDYRPNRYRESFLPPSFDSGDEFINPAALNGTSRKRSRRDSCIATPSPDSPNTTTAPTGWGRTVIKAVSKVLDLCWTGAFRGFYAGGGQGYDMPPATATATATTVESSWQPSANPSAEKQMYSTNAFCSTPVPGHFADEEIDRSWVFVSESSDPFVGSSAFASPSLRTRRAFQASTPRRRPAVMPRLKRVSCSSGPQSPTKSQGLPSPRSRDVPGSAEIQRQAAKIRRKEREEDASIQRLNKQLQAMIREGKEALGTTVVVDDLDMYDSE